MNEGWREELLSIMNMGDHALNGSFSPSIGEIMKRNRRLNLPNALIMAVEESKPISKVFECILNKMEVVSKFLSVSSEGHEELDWHLFTALERDGSERNLR